MDCKIKKITYSFGTTNIIIQKIFANDYKGGLLENNTLTDKLVSRMEEIINVFYPLHDDRIFITIKTDSVKKYDPSKNVEYWQDISQIINNHISKPDIKKMTDKEAKELGKKIFEADNGYGNYSVEEINKELIKLGLSDNDGVFFENLTGRRNEIMKIILFELS